MNLEKILNMSLDNVLMVRNGRVDVYTYTYRGLKKIIDLLEPGSFYSVNFETDHNIYKHAIQITFYI